MNNTLDKRAVRKTYLITYSQVDKNKSSDKERFTEQVIEAFDPTKESNVQPVQWASCEEYHQEDGTHYHMCLKMSNNKRWLGAARYLREVFKINVHFSDSHHNYMSAYRYVLKDDPEPFHSPGHPNLDLTTSPKTSKANKSRLENRRTSSIIASGEIGESSNSKRKRLSKADVMDIIHDRNIKGETEFLALAAELAEDGQSDLKIFVANTPERIYRELISKTWKLVDAPKELHRQMRNRMECLRENLLSECCTDCKGNKLWLTMAKEILKENKINSYVFAEAVRSLLQQGRGKNRNILIVGPANCGKTFLLNPLTRIFKVFVNPSSSKYAFVGVEENEVIFLNDLRWNQEMIPWQEFLNLLEGQTVHLAAPKTHFAKDICIEDDKPIFATSITMVKFTGRSDNIDGENAMMEARWRKFDLTVRIPEANQKDVESCARCFSELVFLGAEDF